MTVCKIGEREIFNSSQNFSACHVMCLMGLKKKRWHFACDVLIYCRIYQKGYRVNRIVLSQVLYYQQQILMLDMDFPFVDSFCSCFRSICSCQIYKQLISKENALQNRCTFYRTKQRRKALMKRTFSRAYRNVQTGFKC